MASQIVCVLAESFGLRIYAIMLPPGGFWVAHWRYIDIHMFCIFIYEQLSVDQSSILISNLKKTYFKTQYLRIYANF